MPKGVYERTPEHNAAISRALTGVPKTPEHRIAISISKEGENNPMYGISPNLKTRMAISDALIGVPKTPEHCAAISDATKGENNPMFGHEYTEEELAVLSEAQRNSDASKAQIESMRGGNDIVNHHYIYDHSDLSKYTMEVTRSKHGQIHAWLKKANIIIPHINIKE